MFKEDSELISFFDYVRLRENQDARLKTIYHIANERKSSPQAGARMKRKGVRRGIPDVCVPIATKEYSGLYLEFKVKPNKLTKEQKEMCFRLIGQGCSVKVVWSASEAIKILEEYLATSAST